MNGAIVYRLDGSCTAGSSTAWNQAANASGSASTTSNIKFCAGYFWILLNITIFDTSSLDDTETFEWSVDEIFPSLIPLYTKEHTHYSSAFVGIPEQLGAGPRLIYQTPMQVWCYAEFLTPTDVSLTCSCDCDLEIVIIRHATTANMNAQSLELKD